MISLLLVFPHSCLGAAFISASHLSVDAYQHAWDSFTPAVPNNCDLSWKCSVFCYHSFNIERYNKKTDCLVRSFLSPSLRAQQLPFAVAPSALPSTAAQAGLSSVLSGARSTWLSLVVNPLSSAETSTGPWAVVISLVSLRRDREAREALAGPWLSCSGWRSPWCPRREIASPGASALFASPS